MSEYAIDEAAGLEDGGEYTGSEGDYSGLGYEDYGQGAGAEQGFAETPAEGDFTDVEQAVTDALELGLLTPAQVGEFMRAQVAAEIAPTAEAVQEWQTQQATEATTSRLLDWMGGEFEKSGVPEDRFDEGAEAVLELAAGLFEGELERVGSERGQHERDQIVADYVRLLEAAGYTTLRPEDAAALSAEIDGLAEQRVAGLAASDATVRALGEWIRSLDPGAAVKNYSVAKRMAEQGPLPSTRQAFREAGWTPEQIQPRSPSEAVLANDTRRNPQPPGSTKTDYRRDKRSVTMRTFGSEL
jgi:hypothetical protein